MSRGPLEGKLALVTGGGRGIGRAIGLELARRARTCSSTTSAIRMPPSRPPQSARALGVRAETLRGNVADEAHVERLFGDVRERFGYLDILVNNSASGVNRAGDRADHPPLGLDAQRQCARRLAVRPSRPAADADPRRRRHRQYLEPRRAPGDARLLSGRRVQGRARGGHSLSVRWSSRRTACGSTRSPGGLVETDALKSFAWGTDVIEQTTAPNAGRAHGRARGPGAGGGISVLVRPPR